jgi:hypothetical protein
VADEWSPDGKPFGQDMRPGLQSSPTYYSAPPGNVNSAAIKFLEIRGSAGYAVRRENLGALIAKARPAIPAGELYAYRVRCTGQYDREQGMLVGPCGWEGASSRVSGSHTVPACPRCGGLTEPVAGGPRLRRIQ